MNNEKPLTITVSIDPDLCRQVKSTNRKHEDLQTGEIIPKGSSCYAVGYRYDSRLFKGYLTEANYQNLIR